MCSYLEFMCLCVSAGKMLKMSNNTISSGTTLLNMQCAGHEGEEGKMSRSASVYL